MAKKAKKKPKEKTEAEKKPEPLEEIKKPKKSLGKIERTPEEQKKAAMAIKKLYKLQMKLNGGVKMTPEDWTKKK